MFCMQIIYLLVCLSFIEILVTCSKCYLYNRTSEQELRVTLDEIVQSVVKEFLRPEKWGLESRS